MHASENVASPAFGRGATFAATPVKVQASHYLAKKDRLTPVGAAADREIETTVKKVIAKVSNRNVNLRVLGWWDVWCMFWSVLFWWDRW